MSHELTMRADGTAEMAYIGEVPWHGLGQKLQEGASIDEWRVAAGMDWRIQRSVVRYATARQDVDPLGASMLEFPDQHVLFRSDNKLPLGVVSSKYETHQPREILEFFRDITEGAGFKMETAGTLFGGRKFWALASIGETAMIMDRDQVRGHLLIATACDGSSKTACKFVGTRVVCNNAMSIAMRERDARDMAVSHRSRFNPGQLKDALKIVHGAFAESVMDMQRLTKVRLDAKASAAFVRNLLRPVENFTPGDFPAFLSRLVNAPESEERAPRGEAKILSLFQGEAMGANFAGVKGTAWGLLNAVTEYVDHHATAKSTSHRIDSAWFNGGDDLKTTAFSQLLALAA